MDIYFLHQSYNKTSNKYMYDSTLIKCKILNYEHKQSDGKFQIIKRNKKTRKYITLVGTQKVGSAYLQIMT